MSFLYSPTPKETEPMTTIHSVRAGQVYEACHPLEFTRIRVVAYTPGTSRADVVDATTGKRPRAVLVSALHASGVTASGEPRRRGYRLVEDLPDSPESTT